MGNKRNRNKQKKEMPAAAGSWTEEQRAELMRLLAKRAALQKQYDEHVKELAAELEAIKSKSDA